MIPALSHGTTPPLRAPAGRVARLRQSLADIDDARLDEVERDIERFRRTGVCSALVLRLLREHGKV